MISSASHDPNWNEFRLCGGGTGAGDAQLCLFQLVGISRWSHFALRANDSLAAAGAADEVTRGKDGAPEISMERAGVCCRGTVALVSPEVAANRNQVHLRLNAELQYALLFLPFRFDSSDSWHQPCSGVTNGARSTVRQLLGEWGSVWKAPKLFPLTFGAEAQGIHPFLPSS